MPVARATYTEVDHLRPYVFHGLSFAARGNHAVADCPFCGREGKFSVEVATGLWRCLVCGTGTAAGGGNALVFTRLIYEAAATANVGVPGALFRASVANDRRLLSPDTVAAWGVCPAADGAWMVPGYSAEGRLDQVYRRTSVQEKGEWVQRLLPTPGVWPDGKSHALHLPHTDFDPARPRPNVVVCEGPWDAMALWEVTQNDQFGVADIIAVPGCNVWRDEWTAFCRGKTVTLLFDSDHPKEYVPGRVSRAGYDGMQRVTRRLSGVAASVRHVKWGPDGYDPARPSGWDVRDHLTSDSASVDKRQAYLADLILKVEDAPREWFSPTVTAAVNGHSHQGSVEALPCSSWAECEAAWKEAIQWRRELAGAMSVLLAVCASTPQAGNQLFLDLIGSPGNAKTTLCRSLLVSEHCIHLENATKIISGYKKPGDDEKDCSFLARANNKTWVTCEFDTLANVPQYAELMGKIRRIFDGETSATYGNSDVDRLYTALRTPWIRAGTPRMMDHDQSQLGDRFLRYIINDPEADEKRAIVRAAMRSERAAIVERSNASAGSILDPKTRRAYALTGGYVDWLWSHFEEGIIMLEVPESAEEFCMDLAELSADLRARPTDEKKKVESYDVRELPTRLARQNIRLATCLALVLNKRVVDTDVLRIVRKVAMDTAAGHSLNIVQWMSWGNPRAEYLPHQETGGLSDGALENWTSMDKDRLKKYTGFLRNIDVLAVRNGHGTSTWVLTDRVYDLYNRIMREI